MLSLHQIQHHIPKAMTEILHSPDNLANCQARQISCLASLDLAHLPSHTWISEQLFAFELIKCEAFEYFRRYARLQRFVENL